MIGSPGMIRGVFFDLDGTLFDTRADIVEAYRRVFKEEGIPFDSARLKIGPPLEECVRTFCADVTPERMTRIINGYRMFYEGCGFPQTLPYPGVMEMLRTLFESGKKLFVATNKRMAPTREIMERQRVKPMLSGIYTPDGDPEHRRKKTENLLLAMESCGLTPGECVMVGDTFLDVRAGHEAGMAAVGVTWGYDENGLLAASSPERIIRRPGELSDTLETL